MVSHTPNPSAGGRTGTFLFILGIFSILIGMAYIATATSPAVDLAFSWLPQSMDANELAWLWLLSGIIQIAASIFADTHRKLVPIGYSAGVVVPGLWGMIFLLSGLFGNPYGVARGLIYMFVATIVWYLAGWSNPHSVTYKSLADSLKRGRDNAAN